MPRAAAVSVENNFTKGLITEVTGVNSPENSVSSSVNTVYDRKGRAMTRNSFAYEEANVNQSLASTGVVSEFYWETVSNNNGVNFEVIQTGPIIKFFQATSGASLSAGQKAFQIDLRTYKVALFPDTVFNVSRCGFTSGKGYLFIAHPNCDTLYVKYDITTDNITVTPIIIKIRDFQGIDDTIGVDQRLTTLTATHKYNLYNQGWYTYAKINGGATPNVLDRWFQVLANYPSNVDFWWYYVTTDTSGTSTGEDNFDPSTQGSKTGLLGNTPAPKGHYTIDALNTNRASLSGVAGVHEDSSGGYRASVVSFFTGRAFYAGIGASGFSSTIYFTQIIEADDQLYKCYQLNDPTSKQYFDLLANDGGTIKIQDINTILDMKVIGQSLYVFASNGVWAVTGSNDGPFKATDYTVSKISAFPAISRTSIVDVGGLPLWWNYEGIFSLQKTQTGLTTEVTNLSQSTIQTFYDAIPQNSKTLAKGAYNDQSGLVYWLYNDTDRSDNKFLNILALDVLTGAFYPMTIPDVDQSVVGLSSIRSSGSTSILTNVTLADLSLVTLSTLEPVQIAVPTGFSSKSKTFKFITVGQALSTITFSELRGSDSLDWGVTPYDCHFITGYRIRGDLLKQFQTNYLTVISEDIDGYIGSCYHQNLWDYADDPDSGRYSNPQQIYRQRFARKYQRSKLMTRGNGYSLQFKFFNEPGKPFIIVGWAGFETANQVP